MDLARQTAQKAYLCGNPECSAQETKAVDILGGADVGAYAEYAKRLLMEEACGSFQLVAQDVHRAGERADPPAPCFGPEDGCFNSSDMVAETPASWREPMPVEAGTRPPELTPFANLAPALPSSSKVRPESFSSSRCPRVLTPLALVQFVSC